MIKASHHSKDSIFLRHVLIMASQGGSIGSIFIRDAAHGHQMSCHIRSIRVMKGIRLEERCIGPFSTLSRRISGPRSDRPEAYLRFLGTQLGVVALH
jgi:hypothetical protein